MDPQNAFSRSPEPSYENELVKNQCVTNSIMLARDMRDESQAGIVAQTQEGLPVNSTRDWKGKLDVPDALRRGHDEARAEFVRAAMEGGRIGRASKRVAELCLPHFEHEESSVFPVLALLPDLTRGTMRPEMMDLMPLIAGFRAKHDAITGHHQSILGAIEEFLQAAHKEKNREFAEFAYNLRVHESIEDEVIYPTVILIGNYLAEKFAK